MLQALGKNWWVPVAQGGGAVLFGVATLGMFVPVLMASCHVSLNPKTGPLNAQMTITAIATTSDTGEPTAVVIAAENRRNASCMVGSCSTLSRESIAGTGSTGR